MSDLAELLESRRVALVRAGEVSAELAALRAREAELADEWGREWKGLLDLGFSERELRGAGLVPPVGPVKRKPKARSRSRLVGDEGGRRALDVPPDGEDGGVSGE